LNGHLSAVKLLLDYGADHNHMNNCGWSLLLAAGSEGEEEIIQQLLAQDAESDSGDSEGQMLPSIAANKVVVKMLINTLPSSSSGRKWTRKRPKEETRPHGG
jgi:ankyrin repeat protein